MKKLKFIGVCLVLTVALLCVVMSCKNDDSRVRNTVNNDPTFNTEDVKLFWNVFDKFESTGSVSWQKEYIDQGSDALKEFDKSRNLGFRLFNTMQSSNSIDYYRSIRSETDDFSGEIGVSRTAMLQLDAIYPRTQFYTVNFLIGALSTGGTVSSKGPIIAVEMWTKTENSPISGLGDWEQQIIKERPYLPSIVIHEFVHMQQQALLDQSIGSSTLEISIMEGMADYVSQFLLEDQPTVNQELHNYGDPIEEQIWNEFKAEMGLDYRTTDWVYKGNETSNGHPADMGYYVGYKILEAYTKNFESVEEAIASMLSATSYLQVFEESKYEDKF